MEKDNKITTAYLPEIKEMYEAPIIKMVEVKVEQGFQASPGEPETPV